METIKKIRSDFIMDPAKPMRVDLDKDALWELAESIKKDGLINPITVRPKGDHYEVVAGHRRFKACQIAGIVEISCVVRELNDSQMFEIMAAENLERKDVSPLEEALFIFRLSDELKYTVADIAKKLNRSETWVQDRLAIIDYPEYMQIAIEDGTLKLGVAQYLARINDDAYCKQFVDSAVKNGMSVLQARFLATQYEMGILVPSETILPSNEELQGGEQVSVRAMCVRCGKIAVDPNLQSVFIHKDCPLDDVVASE